MRPSGNMSFEPGLERGVPWGRDLFTFVTSAAGHMMRTLQKPRKNKPSKRQVNHRRFLHNMIQRKFAEIEAANQQLASALLSADSSQSPQKTKSHNDTNESVTNTEKATAFSCETEKLSKQQDEVNDHRSLKSVVVNPDIAFFKSKAITHSTNGEDSHLWESVEVFEHSQDISPRQIADFNCEKVQNQSKATNLDNLTQVTNMILEDSVYNWLESIERIRHKSEADITKSTDEEQDRQYLGITLFDMSPISPAVSPLSLDSCDFEEQLHPDSEHSSEVQHITESLEMDVMENLELLVSSEEYLQNHQNDQTNVGSNVWDIHSEEEESCFQDNLTFLLTSNSPPERYVVDNPTEPDCTDEVFPGGLELGPLVTTLMESSAKDIDAERGFSSYAACSLASSASSCLHDQSHNASREKGHCCLNQLDISTLLNKKNGTWGTSKTVPKSLEQSEFASHTLNSQALQRLEHAPPNQTLSNHWHQHPTHEDHAQSRSTGPFNVTSDAERNSNIQKGTPPNPNSVNTSPSNPLFSSTSHCCNFEDNRLINGTYREDFCSFSDFEADAGIASFEGVAQSFPAPVNKPHPYSISTPPLNDDWLFSNIVVEQDFNCMIRSQGCAYC